MRPVLFSILLATAAAAEPIQLSGIYPSLAMFNNEGECGTGAVVPWADRLWVITYAPHKPKGSSDKLYEITPNLHQIIRPESIGGTLANRMIHTESKQLFIGPHAISDKGEVRMSPYATMFGRHAKAGGGIVMARHLNAKTLSFAALTARFMNFPRTTPTALPRSYRFPLRSPATYSIDSPPPNIVHLTSS